MFSTTVQNPYGLHPGPPIRCRCTMRGSAGSKGNVVYFDIGATDAASTSDGNAFGQKAYHTANVVLATASHDLVGYIYGVLEADAADDAEVWVTVRGVVQALGGATIDVDGAQTTSGVYNGACTVVAGSELSTTVQDSSCIAIALEDVADATLSWFIFDGVHGFGTRSVG